MMEPTKVYDVVYALLALLVADETMVEEEVFFAERMTVETIERVPGCYWYMLDITPTENFEETILRLDLWANGTKQMVRIQNRVRAKCHYELPVTLGDVYTFCQLRRWIDVGEGSGEDRTHHVAEIALQAVRERPRA